MSDEPFLPCDVAELDARGFGEATGELAALLVDAVESGASVGFVLPFTDAAAKAWWRALAPDVAAERIVVLVARVAGSAVGTARRRGVGRALMVAIEDAARRRGRTLLVLDTISGSDAVKLYESTGWTRAGEIPRYAAMPDGTLAPTTYFYKELR